MTIEGAEMYSFKTENETFESGWRYQSPTSIWYERGKKKSSDKEIVAITNDMFTDARLQTGSSSVVELDRF